MNFFTETIGKVAFVFIVIGVVVGGAGTFLFWYLAK